MAAERGIDAVVGRGGALAGLRAADGDGGAAAEAAEARGDDGFEGASESRTDATAASELVDIGESGAGDEGEGRGSAPHALEARNSL